MGEHILIVDDDPLLCNLLRMALGRAGFKTAEMYSGDTALEYLQGQTVDLVLLDIMMADVNGFDVLRKLKANSEWRKIPVILLTARVDAISQRTGMDIGAVEYLTKPITPDLLIERIQAVLASRS
ncbi:MAG: response regulator [Chloroflexi bacterium]|nr:response regulator [Chloroflexota bacterium]